MKIIESVRSIVFRDNPINSIKEVLMIEQAAKKFHLRQNPNALKTYWDFPGGKIDEGDTVIDAACRETKEETGVTPKNPFIAFDITKAILEEDFRRNITVVVFSSDDSVELSTQNDPDHQILRADWKSIDEAVVLLGQIQDRDLSEPLVDFLINGTRFMHWEYQMELGGNFLNRICPSTI